MLRTIKPTLLVSVVLLHIIIGIAPANAEDSSPWLFTPTVSSDPKMGTSVGAMAGYLHHFDEQSPVSMFGAMASYSSTDSRFGGLFAKTYFNYDKQRLMGGVFGGFIRNDYEDFLGSGLNVETDDDLFAAAIRYYQRINGDWFVGLQGISTDYQITSDDPLSGGIIELIGLTGFRSNGIGFALQHDSRDDQHSPAAGHNFEASNVAFRKSFGGDVSFDSYTASYSAYHGMAAAFVLAYRVKGRWTHNAPTSGYSSVELRGYTRGQYLAPHSSFAEVEGRFKLKKRWGATLFSGLACLYTSGSDCGYSNNLYPNIGAGLTYLLKPEDGMIVRAEYAQGKADNRGFYLQFGQPF